MEKLLELLNEYWKWSFELEIDNDTWELTWWIVDAHQDTFEVTSYYITMQIISKRFWFIERLVKNDKIEWNEKTAFVTFLEREINADKSDALVSLLAVQDNPIEYLCSILKE
jgi:hypothetical protein